MIRFFERPYPSANTILLEGARPVLVDPGSGPELGQLLRWLDGIVPALVVNTHWHVDHSGANAAMRAPVAAPAAEAAAAAAGDPDMCRALFLAQVTEPYRVDRALVAGDEVEGWEVVALPGHTAAQIGLWDGGTRTLIAGDALHDGDVGWLDLDADPGALEQAEATVAAIGALAPVRVLSGHGPEIVDVAGALERAGRRLASWRREPARIAWHACKRILTHGLMMEDGWARDAVRARLIAAPWFRAHAGRVFGVEPEAFVPMLLDEMLRSGAARWADERLMPVGVYVRGS